MVSVLGSLEGIFSFLIQISTPGAIEIENCIFSLFWEFQGSHDGFYALKIFIITSPKN